MSTLNYESKFVQPLVQSGRDMQSRTGQDRATERSGGGSDNLPAESPVGVRPAEVQAESPTRNSLTSSVVRWSDDDTRGGETVHGGGPDRQSVTLMTAGQRIGVAAAVLLTLLSGVVGILLGLDALRAAAVSMFLLCGVGTGPLLLIRSLTLAWFTLLAVTGSLATSILLGLAMALARQWHPMTMFVALAAVWVLLSAVALAREMRQMRGVPVPAQTPVVWFDVVHDDQDGLTRDDQDGPGRVPELSEPTRWTLHLGDGRLVDVDRVCVVGRAPSQFSEDNPIDLITVVDPSESVSPNHLLLLTVGNELFVVDQGSDSGTTVSTESGTSTRCEPLVAMRLEDGDVVSFGGHWFGDLWFEIRSEDAAL